MNALRSVLAGVLACGCTLALAQSLPANIPLKRDAVDHYASNTAALFILGLIAVALMIVGYAWRRRKTAPNHQRPLMRWWPEWIARSDTQNQSLKIIHSTRLGARVTLHDVQWQQQKILIACTDTQVTVLAQCAASTDMNQERVH